MIDLCNTRPGNVMGFTGTADLRAQRNAKASKGCASGKVGPRMSLVKQADATQDSPSSLRCCRLKYMYSAITVSEKGCTVFFSNSDGEPWDASEMTPSEWDFLREEIEEMAKSKGLSAENLPIYLIPPEVTRRMNEDDAYADFILGGLQGGAPSHRLVMNEDGSFTDLDTNEKARAEPEKDGREDFWKARLERQAEYIRYVQQARIEHTREITREFAALRGLAQESKAAR